MRRGFYTGLAAVLAFLALSGIWLLASSQSYRDVADLTRFASLKVAAHAWDAGGFLSTSLADAEGDAAFGVHGCVPSGAFCVQARNRAGNYTLAAAGALSNRFFQVNASVFNFSCAPLAVVPSGFSNAYSVNVSVNVSVSGGPVRAWRWVNQSDVVLVNASTSFFSRVNSSGPAGLWDVSVNCPVP